VLPGRDHAAVLRWLASADVVACPSRHESFGLVAAEAAILGRSVIATDVGQHSTFATRLQGQTDSGRDWAAAVQLTGKSVLKLGDVKMEYSPGKFLERMSSIYEVPSDSDMG
jgi:D-inositol-3-phosphate glycosyltransferase